MSIKKLPLLAMFLPVFISESDAMDGNQIDRSRSVDFLKASSGASGVITEKDLDLQDENYQLQNQIKKLHQAVSKQRLTQKALESKLIEQANQTKSKCKEIEQLNQTASEQKLTQKALESRLNEQIQTKDEEIERLRKEAAASEQKLTQRALESRLNEQIQTKDKEIERLRNEVEKLRRNLANEQDESKRLQDTNDRVVQLKQTLDKQRAERNKKVGELEKMVTQLTNQAQSQEQKTKTLNEEWAKYKEQAQIAQQQMAQQQKPAPKIVDLLATNEKLRKQIEEMREKSKGQESIILKLTQDLGRLVVTNGEKDGLTSEVCHQTKDSLGSATVLIEGLKGLSTGISKIFEATLSAQLEAFDAAIKDSCERQKQLKALESSDLMNMLKKTYEAYEEMLLFMKTMRGLTQSAKEQKQKEESIANEEAEKLGKIFTDSKLDILAKIEFDAVIRTLKLELRLTEDEYQTLISMKHELIEKAIARYEKDNKSYKNDEDKIYETIFDIIDNAKRVYVFAKDIIKEIDPKKEEYLLKKHLQANIQDIILLALPHNGGPLLSKESVKQVIMQVEEELKIELREKLAGALTSRQSAPKEAKGKK